MMWEIRSLSLSDRWFRADGDTWKADDATSATLRAAGPFAAAPLTPTGPVYEPVSGSDPTALYLNVVAAIPGRLQISGDPPRPPDVPAPDPDVVY